MFAVLTVFAVWLAYEVNWLRQRREVIGHSAATKSNGMHAPGMLWVFGEPAYSRLIVTWITDRNAAESETIESDLLRHAQRLFPEAESIKIVRDAHRVRRTTAPSPTQPAK